MELERDPEVDFYDLRQRVINNEPVSEEEYKKVLSNLRKLRTSTEKKPTNKKSTKVSVPFIDLNDPVNGFFSKPVIE